MSKLETYINPIFYALFFVTFAFFMKGIGNNNQILMYTSTFVYILLSVINISIKLFIIKPDKKQLYTDISTIIFLGLVLLQSYTLIVFPRNKITLFDILFSIYLLVTGIINIKIYKNKKSVFFNFVLLFIFLTFKFYVFSL